MSKNLARLVWSQLATSISPRTNVTPPPPSLSYIPLPCNDLSKPRGFQPVVSIEYQKIGSRKNVLTDSVIGRSAFQKSDIFRSVCLVMYFLNINFYLVKWKLFRSFMTKSQDSNVSWQNWTGKQCPNLIHAAAKLKKKNKDLTQSTYYLPCLVPYLLQLMNKLDASLEASVRFMLMFLKNYLDLCKHLLPTV